MSIINNIPQAMITEHVAWHMRPGNPSAGGREIDPFPPVGPRPAPGSGEEFLVWHQGYVERFRTWVQTLPAAERDQFETDTASWTAVPQMLKMSMLGWNTTLADEERQLSDMSNFETLDELGQFLEWSLHGFLHNAASDMNMEPVLLGFESPRSTFFWQLHGLIDHWRQAWIDASQSAPPIGTAELTVNGDIVETSIGTAGEVDRFRFSIPASGTYTLETSGPSDVVLYVGGPNNDLALHSQNDDGGENFNAKIESDFDQGEYMAYVVLYDRSQTGNYSISLRN